jgi:Domain of unknown function (DUF4136)
MKNFKAVAIRLAPVLIAALSLQADDFRNDFDPDGKFSQYKVFCFVKGIELDKSGLLSQPGMPNRIMNLISGVLQNRGMNEVPIDQKFDLAVRYWVARQQKTEVQDLGPDDPYWGAWGGYPVFWDGPWAFDYDDFVIKNYTQRTLIVDLLERKSKQLIWRTYLKDDVQAGQYALEVQWKDLNKAMVAYPPSAKEIEKMRQKRAQQAKKAAQ